MTTRPSVLIVDDEPQILNAVGDVLEDRCEVLVANSADQGLGIISAHPKLAVILSDQRMPGLTGDRFLAYARERCDAARILITAYADLSAVINAVNQGKIFAYISKPWHPDHLQLMVARAIEHCALQRELQTERALLHNLLDNAIDAIYFKDSDEHLTRMNRAQASMLCIDELEQAELALRGTDLEAVIGKVASDRLSALASDDAKVLESQQASVDRVLEIDIDGKRWYSTTKAPLLDDKSHCHGLVSITRDITRHKKAELLIAEREAALRQSTEIARLGHRILDADLKVIRSWSPNLLELLELTDDEAPRTLDGWLERVHPSDVDAVLAAFENGRKSPVDVIYRALGTDGTWRYFREMIEASPDDDVSAGRFSTLQDISEGYESTAQVRLLLQVTQAIEKAGTVRDALRACVECVSTHTAWAYGEAWVPDAGSDDLTIEAWFEGSDTYRELYSLNGTLRVSKGQGLAGAVWQKRVPTFFDENAIASQICRRRDILNKLRLKAAMGVPILDDNDEVMAVLIFFPGPGIVLDERSIAVASNVAQQLGSSLKRMRTLQQLNESESRFRNVANNIPGVLCRFVRQTDGRVDCTYISSGARTLFGKHLDPSTTTTLQQLSQYVHVADRQRFEDFLCGKRTRTRKRIDFRIEVGGETRHVNAYAIAHKLDSGATELHAVLIDITEQRRAEEHVEFLKYHDELTNLPNRKLLVDTAYKALTRAASDNKLVAAIAVQVDQYRIVQETLGAEASAEMLVAAAERLHSCLGEHDSLGRTGESEFLLLMHSVNDVNALSMITKQVETAIAGSLTVAGSRVHLTGTLGVSSFPDDALNPEELLGHATTACDRARAENLSVLYFKPEMNKRAVARLSLEQRMREALDKQEFTLHYQPQVCLNTHRVIGVESLLRWPMGDGNFTPPSEFIPLAEQSGLIVPLGEWVLDEVSRQIRRWQEAGIEIPVCVNISAQQLRTGSIFQQLGQLIEERSVPPSLLKVELTESGLVEHPDNIANLQSFRNIGVGISIDDFGTGYSSLRYLRELPIDILKVDKSFIDNMVDDARSAAIVNTIITLGHGLNMTVIAEGVEHKDQLTFLRAYNCDSVQGYVFHKPMPAEDILSVVKKSEQSVC